MMSARKHRLTCSPCGVRAWQIVPSWRHPVSSQLFVSLLASSRSLYQGALRSHRSEGCTVGLDWPRHLQGEGEMRRSAFLGAVLGLAMLSGTAFGEGEQQAANKKTVV